MRIGRTSILAAVCTLASLLVPARSHALFHISVIDEVLASLDGDADQQFVEVRMLLGAQNLVSNAVIAAFDASGDYIEDILVIPEDVPNGVNGARWIAATSAFQTAHAFTADFTMPAKIRSAAAWSAGRAGRPATGRPGELGPRRPGQLRRLLAYGTYSGPSNHLIGKPTTLVAEGHSLVRQSETDDNAADFACANTATPTNNAGASVDVPASSRVHRGARIGIQVTPDSRACWSTRTSATSAGRSRATSTT